MLLLAKTFPRGGGKIPHRKSATENKAIVICNAPEEVVIPFNQHIGNPSQPVIGVGDYVKLGQKIGESSGYISANVHSSVSGRVLAIDKRNLLDGSKGLCAVIGNDGLDQLVQGEGYDYTRLSPEQIITIIKEAGIVGLGGAGFPTHVKYSATKPIDTVIINGAECEPYLTCDHRLMLEQPALLIDGLKSLMKALGAKNGVIAVEINKPDAIELLRSITESESNIKVISLKVKYPQGAEKQLIKAVLGREIPSGRLPADVACIVNNVHTVVSVAEAIQQGIGLYQRVLTISGSLVWDPRNLLVRIGTPIKEVIDFCGGMIRPAARVIAGGPMTGKPVFDLSGPIVKTVSGILVLSNSEVSWERNNPCIRCGRCIDHCPMGLQPNFLADFCDKGIWDKAQEYHAMDCIECGLCSYVCPAYRGLCCSIKQGKATLKAKQSNQVTEVGSS